MRMRVPNWTSRDPGLIPSPRMMAISMAASALRGRRWAVAMSPALVLYTATSRILLGEGNHGGNPTPLVAVFTRGFRRLNHRPLPPPVLSAPRAVKCAARREWGRERRSKRRLCAHSAQAAPVSERQPLPAVHARAGAPLASRRSFMTMLAPNQGYSSGLGSSGGTSP